MRLIASTASRLCPPLRGPLQVLGEPSRLLADLQQAVCGTQATAGRVPV